MVQRTSKREYGVVIENMDQNIIHLIGMTEEEAEACIEEHGLLPNCSQNKCTNQAVLHLLFKKPGSGFAQDVSAMAACKEHKAKLEELIKNVLGET